MAIHASLRRTMRWAAVYALACAAVLPAAAQLPPERQQGSVAFVSGGIGEDESTAMREAARQYPLALQFVSRTGETPGAFLADVEVSINDSRGNPVLQTRSGPFLLARLPPGRYTVTAAHDGVQRSQRVSVPSRGTRRVVFGW